MAAPLPRAYPPAARGAVADELHGVRVPDPYRWLEEDSAETKAWIKSQQAFYADYANDAAARTLQASIRARQEALYNYGRVGLPTLRGARAFFFRNTGLQNQDVLFVDDAGAAGAAAPGATFAGALAPRARALLDLNAEYPAGTTSLATWAPSHDGALLAYGLAHAGSDWVTVKVRDVASGADLPGEEIEWAKFTSLAWLKDDSGFFYSRYPAPPEAGGGAGTETAANENAAVCFHRVRTPAAADLLVYATPEQPLWRASAWASEDGAYIFLSTSKGTDPVNRLYVARARTFAAWAAGAYLPFRRVVDNFEAEYDVVAARGRVLFLKTNLHAPRGRVVALELPADDAAGEWEAPAPLFSAGAPPRGAGIDAPAAPTPDAALAEVLPQHATEVLDWCAQVAGDVLVTCVMKDVVNVLRVARLPALGAPPAAPLGAPRDVPLPGPGTVASFAAREDADAFFVKFVSFTTPGTSLAYDARALVAAADGAAPPLPAPFWAADLPGFDAADFVVSQDFVAADDGARIPVFLVHKKGLALPAPTLLYAYGGFGISLQPSFSSTRLAWLTDLGGVFALACIRGGGEYGKEAWHDAGRRLKKRTCFTDFAAVARALAARGVTRPESLAIMGGSNGGLLTLAVAQREPALVAAAVSQVPVGDLLRFSKFTIGHAWQGEYGFVDDREVRGAARAGG